MGTNRYADELHDIIHRNRMYDYEEVNMAFIAAKLIHLQAEWGRKISLVLRSDFIEDKTYWFIRYFRSKNVEPAVILSTPSCKEKYKEGVFGIPLAVIGEMNDENTKDSILIIVNRESDRNKIGRRIDGVEVINYSDFRNIQGENAVVVTPNERKEIVEKLMQDGVEYMEAKWYMLLTRQLKNTGGIATRHSQENVIEIISIPARWVMILRKTA